MYNVKKLDYKFVPKYYYIEECYVNGSEMGHKDMVMMSRDIIYYVSEKTKVKKLSWPGFTDFIPIIILEGPNKGRVAFVDPAEVHAEL
jgi:hypothetical protein